jgi:glycerol kinase
LLLNISYKVVMKEKVLVGLDIGTSGLKITLADAKGRIKDHLKFEYQSLPEQQVGVVPVSFYEGIVKQVLTKVAAGYELLAIAVTTQMYSICEKTSEGILVWQWNSLVQRSKDREKLYGSELLKSGCPVDTIYGGYKWFAASPCII